MLQFIFSHSDFQIFFKEELIYDSIIEEDLPAVLANCHFYDKFQKKIIEENGISKLFLSELEN